MDQSNFKILNRQAYHFDSKDSISNYSGVHNSLFQDSEGTITNAEIKNISHIQAQKFLVSSP
jgi:hypothetical protein